ncbi:MAG: biotin--[acetyl-CoA-carboxylase] ligase [Actinobacteria bacterium]|nr:biotin--[acetyl-CoA-carboxylase] ligase [Actinomycetota bacterium]
MAGFGVPHRHHRSTESTNARARELAIAGAPHGLIVTADEQSAGRGRQGRSWFAIAGASLLYSALLRPLGKRPLLPLAVPLAVCEAAEGLARVTCAVKWPNDVWIEGRKLAGVLIESRAGSEGFAVIGVGLNLSVPADAFPEELRGTATSLGLHSDPAPTAAAARAALSDALGRWIDADADTVLAGFRERDALAERRIAWQGGEGTAAGIDDSGHLLVETEAGGTVTLGAGEVHLELGRAEGG